MKFTPEVYQRLAIDHLTNHDRAALFCGIGLGKTASTLAAFRELYAFGEARSMLVVAPMRVANMTWPNEIAKWDQFRQFKVERLRDVGDKPSGKAHIYVTNYERLDRLTDLSFCDTVVFDELTKAKNPSSKRINALRPLMTRQRRWGLTGTPRPNSLLELFAQIRLLDDGKRLSPSFTAFKSAYFDSDYMGYKFTPKAGAEETIYRKIHDIALTLRSSDYLDIADTEEEDIEVPLPKAAHGIYRELEKQLLVMVNGKELVAVNAAALVNKLLQVCGGAAYSTDEAAQVRSVVPIHDAKTDALKKLVGRLDGERALIACNYIHERERVVAALPGAVDAHTFKGDIEDAWNSGSIPYLVADPRGLGHGLNLQAGGRNTIWYSPTYSRELYDQFNGRLARKGQTLVPRVFRLTCPGTMDDVAIETLRTRGDEQGEMLAMLTNFRLQGATFS